MTMDPAIPRFVYRLPPGVQRVIVYCFLGCVLERLAKGYRTAQGPVMPWYWRPPVRAVRAESAEQAIATGLLVPISAGLFGDVHSWVGPAYASQIPKLLSREPETVQTPPCLSTKRSGNGQSCSYGCRLLGD